MPPLCLMLREDFRKMYNETGLGFFPMSEMVGTDSFYREDMTFLALRGKVGTMRSCL